jgi:hypothetical protein
VPHRQREEGTPRVISRSRPDPSHNCLHNRTPGEHEHLSSPRSSSPVSSIDSSWTATSWPFDRSRTDEDDHRGPEFEASQGPTGTFDLVSSALNHLATASTGRGPKDLNGRQASHHAGRICHTRSCFNVRGLGAVRPGSRLTVSVACTRRCSSRSDLETDSRCLDRSGKRRLSTRMGSRCRMCHHGHGHGMEVADIEDVSPCSGTSADRNYDTLVDICMGRLLGILHYTSP